MHEEVEQLADRALKRRQSSVWLAPLLAPLRKKRVGLSEIDGIIMEIEHQLTSSGSDDVADVMWSIHELLAADECESTIAAFAASAALTRRAKALWELLQADVDISKVTNCLRVWLGGISLDLALPPDAGTSQTTLLDTYQQGVEDNDPAAIYSFLTSLRRGQGLPWPRICSVMVDWCRDEGVLATALSRLADPILLASAVEQLQTEEVRELASDCETPQMSLALLYRLSAQPSTNSGERLVAASWS